MLYSTCTFAPAEDEQTVSWLLENRPDMELAEMEDYEGFSHGVPEWKQNPELIKCIRIFPHKMNGEGHFLALFRKRTGNQGKLPSSHKTGQKRISTD